MGHYDVVHPTTDPGSRKVENMPHSHNRKASGCFPECQTIYPLSVFQKYRQTAANLSTLCCNLIMDACFRYSGESPKTHLFCICGIYSILPDSGGTSRMCD